MSKNTEKYISKTKKISFCEDVAAFNLLSTLQYVACYSIMKNKRIGREVKIFTIIKMKSSILKWNRKELLMLTLLILFLNNIFQGEKKKTLCRKWMSENESKLKKRNFYNCSLDCKASLSNAVTNYAYFSFFPKCLNGNLFFWSNISYTLKNLSKV